MTQPLIQPLQEGGGWMLQLQQNRFNGPPLCFRDLGCVRLPTNHWLCRCIDLSKSNFNR